MNKSIAKIKHFLTELQPNKTGKKILHRKFSVHHMLNTVSLISLKIYYEKNHRRHIYVSNKLGLALDNVKISPMHLFSVFFYSLQLTCHHLIFYIKFFIYNTYKKLGFNKRRSSIHVLDMIQKQCHIE